MIARNMNLEHLAGLPLKMASASRWLLWRETPNPDPAKKPRKVPFYVDGSPRTGKLDTPAEIARLVTLPVALEALHSRGDDWALGFALGPDSDGFWQGIDLDYVDAHGIHEIAGTLPGYVERSPSGKGVHAIGFGRKFRALGSNATGIEAYCEGRYFTVTADAIGGEPTDLAEYVEKVLKPRHGIERRKSAPNQESNKLPSTTDQTLADVSSALDVLSSDDELRWARYLYALKHSFGEDGWPAWNSWSAKSPKYPGEAAARREWDTRTPNGTLTYKTILEDAQLEGWVNPAKGSGRPASHCSTQDFSELASIRQGETEMDHDDDATVEPDDGAQAAARNSARSAALRGEALADISRRIRRQWPPLACQAENLAKAAIDWAARFSDGQRIQVGGVAKEVVTLDGLNARFAQLEVPGMASCVIHTTDVLPISHKDFQARVSGQVVVVGVNKDGSPKCIPAFRAWRESCLKQTFTEIAFTAGPVKPRALNLFTGFGVDAVQGKCPRILEHIRIVICAGDDAAYEGFLNLLAWQIRHIGKPSRIVVVLFSKEQQIGKGSLLEHVMLPIAGLGGFMSHDPAHGLGNFNDQLRGKWFLFLDECSFAGDRKLADKIKSLAVAQTTPIEGKGLPVISLPSALNIYLATNHEHAANAELHDQRYWFLRVNPSKAGDHDYFAALYDEIDNGGRGAFLHFLLNRDVSGFLPQRDLPRDNEMLADVKRRSLFPGHVAQWIQESLEAGELLWVRGRADENHRAWMDGHDSVQGSLLHAGYRDWVGRVRDRHAREVPFQDFWQCISGFGFEALSANGKRCRKIPHPQTCQQRLKDFINGVTVDAV